MKFVILVAFGFLVVVTRINGETSTMSPNELKKTYEAQKQKVVEECRKQVTLTAEESMKLQRGDLIAPTSNTKCYVKCVYEKLGGIVNGTVQEDAVLKHLGFFIGAENTKIIMKKCNHLTGSDYCDSAFKLFECYRAMEAHLDLLDVDIYYKI